MEREILFLLLLTASLFDISRYRVPNALLAAALIISLFGRFDAQGLFGLWPWLQGILIPFILCYMFYRCRMFGASDCKLFSVIGSFLGLRLLFSIMVVSLFTGAAMAIAKMMLRNNFKSRFRRFFNYVSCCVQEKSLKRYYDRTSEGDDGIIPFTVAISLAVLLCAY